MQDQDYARVLAALDRAIEVFETQPVPFGEEHDAFEKLKEVKTSVEAARAQKTNAGG